MTRSVTVSTRRKMCLTEASLVQVLERSLRSVSDPNCLQREWARACAEFPNLASQPGRRAQYWALYITVGFKDGIPNSQLVSYTSGGQDTKLPRTRPHSHLIRDLSG